MKRTIKRMSCLLLALCMLLTVLPFHADAAEEKAVIDFVLVLDCSGTMLRNDPNQLAADACKMFMDLLPIEDARFSVITFGYGGGGFDFNTFNVKYDDNLIHLLSPLDGDMTIEEQLALKEKITAAAKKDGGNTPVGQALAAGVETLISGGSTDGNACVILLSDGGLTSPIAYQESINLVDSASRKAKEHDWPIYCIELDYKNVNDRAGSENRARLNRICELSGSGAEGRMKVSDPADVCDAFLTIFDHFTDPVNPDHETVVIGEDGYAEKPFTVPNLASEANVVISGSAVDSVEVINQAQGTSVKFDSSKADKKYIVNVEKGSYFSVKIICPEEGEWLVRAYGDENAKIMAYTSSMQELGLEMVVSPDGSERLTKNDTVKVQSYFTYNGTSLNNNTFYLENKASLVVTSYSDSTLASVKEVKEFTMEGDANGFRYELPVSAVPSGVFTVQVRLRHDMFRNGEKLSDAVVFTSENLPLTLNPDAGTVERTGFVNNTFEAVDLTKIFSNPDGDPVEYVLKCTDDRGVSFESKVSDVDMMEISTGMAPGTYHMQIEAKDPDMTEPLVYTGLTLTVENRSIEAKKIPAQKVWVDAYDNFFIRQDAGSRVLDLDMNEYFTDPDGVELTFGEVTVSEGGVIKSEWYDGVLHIEPLKKGDVVVKTTVSDGVETIDAEFTLKSVSGKAEYWKTHWIYYAIAVLIVFVLILFVQYVKRSTTINGSWKVTVRKDYESISTEAGLTMRSLSVVKKAKNKPFAMKNLVNECLNWMDDPNNLQNKCVPFLNMPEAEAIKFKGVFKKKGFVVMNIPTGDNVEVEYNNQVKTNAKKIRVSGGELRVTLKRTDEMGISERMSILFENV